MAPARIPWLRLARPEQLEPSGVWTVWLILAGRGWGKTRTGAEWLRAQALSGNCPHLRIIAPTFADARDVCVEGESGLKALCPPGELVKWNRSMGEGEFANGSRFKVFSGEEPDRLRGPQSYADWFDELASFTYAQDTWDMAMLGLRLGRQPRACVTTTPRPVPVLQAILKGASTHVTRGTTYENRANLAPTFFETIINKYEGTRVGRQELNAELLEDVPGALWTRDLIERCRVTSAPPLKRIVIALDPEATSTADSAETGIIAAGIGDCACKGAKETHGFLLEDASLRASPLSWAKQGIALFSKYHADRLIGEVNNGGEMVESTLRTVAPNIAYKAVHASRGKDARAEPIVALYEQGKVHHVGIFSELEDQQCNWVPGSGAKSPDRLDAGVWALTELMLGSTGWVRGAAR